MSEPPEAPRRPEGSYSRPLRRSSFIRQVGAVARQIAGADRYGEIVDQGGADISLHLIRPGAPTHQRWEVRWRQDGRAWSVEAGSPGVALDRAARMARRHTGGSS